MTHTQVPQYLQQSQDAFFLPFLLSLDRMWPECPAVKSMASGASLPRCEPPICPCLWLWATALNVDSWPPTSLTRGLDQ